MLEPQQLADLWLLRFGTEWVLEETLEVTWLEILKELQKNNYVWTIQVLRSGPPTKAYQLLDIGEY